MAEWDERYRMAVYKRLAPWLASEGQTCRVGDIEVRVANGAKADADCDIEFVWTMREEGVDAQQVRTAKRTAFELIMAEREVNGSFESHLQSIVWELFTGSRGI